MIFVWSLMLACVVISLIGVFCVIFVYLAKRVEASLDKKSVKSKTVKQVKGPFDHLPQALLAACDDPDFPLENVVLLAEDYVTDPPSTPARSWSDDMRAARQARQAAYENDELEPAIVRDGDGNIVRYGDGVWRGTFLDRGGVQ